MKLYEKIYVEQMDSVDRLMVGRWEEHENTIVADAEVKMLSNVIVLTIGELQMMWHVAFNDGYATAEMTSEIPITRDPTTFKSYLTSKGITL